LHQILDGLADPVHVVEPDLHLLVMNRAFRELAASLGLEANPVGRPLLEVFPFLPDAVREEYEHVFQTGETLVTVEHTTIRGRGYVTETRKFPIFEGEHVIQVVTVMHDITTHHQNERVLQAALADARRHSAETRALLAGASAILEYRDFVEAARAIFNAARYLIGAQSGYVALLTPDGEENEVLFLEAGGLTCTVDPELPMPIRGLRAIAYETGEVVYDNAFMDTDWIDFLPEGHVRLENVMFAPLIIDGQKVGLMGLANKPTDFNDADARMAAAFGELAAIALRNSRTLESLEESEQRFRSVVETAGEAIITANNQDQIIFWNQAAIQIFGYLPDEIAGQPLTRILPEYDQTHHQAIIERLAATEATTTVTGKTIETVGQRKDGARFPVEMALTAWQTAEGTFFTGIIRDITARQQAQQHALELAMERERVGLLQEFIGNASHDLKTPLTVIKTSLFVIQRIADRQRQARHLAIIEAQTAHLERVLEDLLNMVRLEHESELRRFPLAVNEFVARLIDEHQPLADHQGNTLCYQPCPEPLTVQADHEQIARALVALLTNALNYTPKGGTVTVRALRRDDRAVIEVADTGIGIAPEALPHIFERFYRGDAARSADRGGMGLGLAIARKVIDAHSGQIEVESTPGEGSVFKIILPLRET